MEVYPVQPIIMLMNHLAIVLQLMADIFNDRKYGTTKNPWI